MRQSPDTCDSSDVALLRLWIQGHARSVRFAFVTNGGALPAVR